jgi:hypothetical protein
MGSAQLDWLVDLGEGVTCSGCCWCPASGLVAVAARREPAGACADLLLIEPHDPSRVARLQAPLSGGCAMQICSILKPGNHPLGLLLAHMPTQPFPS